MPSTPYAASSSSTPIASAKRPKRRAQNTTASVYRGALAYDGKEECDAGRDGVDDKEESSDALNTSKALKSNSNSTPRSSLSPKKEDEVVKGDEEERGAGGETRDIFSPTLHPQVHEEKATEQMGGSSRAPSSTVSSAAPEVDGPETKAEGEVVLSKEDEEREAQGGVEVEHEEEEEEDEEEFNPYCFIAHLPPYNTVKHCTPEAPVLPEKRKTRHAKELTLVLDLDETLVHCTVDPILNPDHSFDVRFNGEEFQVYVRKRPHLDSFLQAVSELFEVVVFTASQQVYAERLLNMIDPQKKYVKYRLYRDACMALEGNYLKDLNVLGRDLSKVAIVDNSPYAYGFQIDNGIPIESWFDDRADEELLHLLPLLRQLITQSEKMGGDVRPFIRSIFKTHELVDKARMKYTQPDMP